jgi:hypothetical protein
MVQGWYVSNGPAKAITIKETITTMNEAWISIGNIDDLERMGGAAALTDCW